MFTLPRLHLGSCSLIAMLTWLGCAGSAKTPAREATEKDARRGHCGLPAISDLNLLRADNPATLDPKDGDHVRLVGRLDRDRNNVFTVRWPCHPVSDFPMFVASPSSCVPENQIVVIEGRAQLLDGDPRVQADGPSFNILDYKIMAVSDEVTACAGERTNPTCGLPSVDQLGTMGASNPTLISPKDGEEVRVAGMLHRSAERFYVNWPCPDTPKDMNEVIVSSGTCMPADGSLIVVEGRAKVPLQATEKTYDGRRFDLVDAKPLAIAHASALCAAARKDSAKH